VISMEGLKQSLSDHLPERHKRLLPANFEALRLGAEFTQKQLQAA
jgi:hypothetical protein